MPGQGNPVLPQQASPVARQVAGGSNLMNVLLGLKDSRGPMGQAARGTNVYNGTSSAPNTGGTVAPMDFNAIAQGAIGRRLKGARRMTKPGQQLQGDLGTF